MLSTSMKKELQSRVGYPTTVLSFLISGLIRKHGISKRMGLGI